ncbi:MAG: hypothetical protein ABFC92_03420 [Rectinema sp.]
MDKFKLPNASRIPTGTLEIASFSIPRIYQPEYRELVTLSPNRLDLELSIHKKPRSTGPYSQGNHLNGHIRQICKETGNEFEDVKLYIKRAAMKRGLRWKTKPNGDIVYSLIDLEPMPISEVDMTSEECSWCIEETHILAAEYGIILIEE